MTRRRAPASIARRSAVVVSVALLITACAGNLQKPTSGTAAQRPSAAAPARSPRKPWKPLGPYTPGGLYAPGVADGAPAEIPADVANLPEPVPHAEPLSRYGNRSPYEVLGKTYTVLPSANGYVERGVASWYGTKFDGRATSNFEPYDIYQFTAAHRTLPLPSYARVTNLDNGRSVIVRINDRGPFHAGRLIDLSYAAAVKLGVNVHGTAPVEVRGIDPGQVLPPAPAVAVAPARPVASTRLVAAPKSVVPVPKPVASTPVAPASGISTPARSIAAPIATGVVAAVVAPRKTTTPSTSPTPPAASSSSPATSSAEPVMPSSAANAAPTATAQLPVGPPAVASTTVMTPAQPAAPLPTTQGSGVSPAAILNGQPLTDRPSIEPSTQGFLQVASYGDRANAEHMLQRLQHAGIEHAELIPVQVAAQTMWRVHIGPVRADEAEIVAQHLDTLGFGYPPFFKE
jgi:rare lipoprotein A